ncbi:unnamed protein product [Ectocarpus fasciculatus]
MGFFDQANTTLETVWFAVLAAVSLLCFPFGIWMGRRFTILAAKLVPVVCLLLAYENIVLALSNVLSDDSQFVQIGRTTRAAVIPLFLVVTFEVAYAVHKRRSVQFCGIVFDQGHRRGVEPCSWVLRNFVGIVSVLLFVVHILVNYDIGIGDDNKAGGTGLVETQDASLHLLLALLPTTGMTALALYIAVYMWKYGNHASIVVQSTVCNGWMFLFLGTLALLGGQVPPEWCFRVVNETGQVLFLLSVIVIGREIGREVQAADNFSHFLEKENELESGGGGGAAAGAAASATSAVLRSHRPEARRPSAATAWLGDSPGTAVTGSGMGMRQRGQKEEEEVEEEGARRRDRRERSGGLEAAEGLGNAAATGAVGDGDVEGGGYHHRGDGIGADGDSNSGIGRDSLDDVTRIRRQRSSSKGLERGGAGRSHSFLQPKKGPALLLEARDGEGNFLSG